MTDDHTASAIDEIAADWAARLDARDLTDEEQTELDAWLALDTRHLGAFARARAFSVAPLVADAYNAPAPRRVRSSSAASGDMHRRAFLGAMAASVAGAALWIFGRREQVTTGAYESVLGEVRRIPLPDGSHVTLNTNSAISVEFAASRRLVRLVRGEAFFEVAKNPDRPFIVMGPMVQVRTVGTSYSVRLVDNTAMKVQVATGRVAIESPPSHLAQSLQSAGLLMPRNAPDLHNALFVDPNQEALITQIGASDVQISVRGLAAETLARALMWRDGHLSFEGDSLHAAVGEFARYSARRIVIADPALGKMHISGLFRTTDADGFARAAALSLRAKVKSEGETIVLYR